MAEKMAIRTYSGEPIEPSRKVEGKREADDDHRQHPSERVAAQQEQRDQDVDRHERRKTGRMSGIWSKASMTARAVP